VLARGFALVRDGAAGAPIRSAAAVSTGQALDIEFADGRVAATATQAQGGRLRQPVRPRARRTSTDPGQGNLF
jgi:exodeoxyribonuclease VII large subunit